MRALLLIALVGCSGDTGGTAATDQELQLCVDQVNSVRGDGGVPLLTRSAALEAYAAAGAEEDGRSRQPHMHYFNTMDAGVAAAENEIPQFSFRAWGGIAAIIDEGVREQANSPSASQTLLGPYTSLGCGIFQMGDEVTVVEDFK